MTSTAAHEHIESVATITLDHSKMNVLSPTIQRNVRPAMKLAENAAGIRAVQGIVLAGNSRVFQCGFDLGVSRRHGCSDSTP